jgi:IS30 family transposase
MEKQSEKQYHHLTERQRYYIDKQIARGASQKEIAEVIGVHKSTVSREVRRNRLKNGNYNYFKAQAKADEKKARSVNNNAISEVTLMLARDLIKEDYSPEQASGSLKKKGIHVSTERIYQLVRNEPELQKHLHHGLKGKRKKKKEPHVTKVKNIPNRTSIRERPKEADGSRFGDWEMDLIVDKDGGAIVTLVERSTRYMVMSKLPNGKNAEGVAKAVVRLLFPYREKVLTITTDNGGEFAQHEMIANGLRMKTNEGQKVYFADSYCSWQKGCIENTNKLIRFYFPKGTDLKALTDEQVKWVQKKLNMRPRKKLDFNTPKEEFFKNFN